MRKVLWTVAVLLIVSFVVAGIYELLGRRTTPRVVRPDAIPSLIRSLPKYAAFTYTGVCILGGSVYAGTNLGLLEVKDGTVRHLYRWGHRDTVVEGPWCDPVRNELWLWQPANFRLLRRIGEKWLAVGMAPPNRGYYRRGDILAGFQIITNEQGIWLLGGGQVSKFDKPSQSWVIEKSPTSTFDDKLVHAIPTPDMLLLVMRHELLDFLIRAQGEEFKSDTVHLSDQGFTQIPFPGGSAFFAERTVYADRHGYVCTRAGNLLRVSDKEILQIDAPGHCEAVTRSSSGRLVASFRGKGIFELSGTWKQLFPCPYPPDEERHFIHVAAGDDSLAVATSGYPELANTGTSGPRTDPQLRRIGTTALWVSQGTELKRIEFAATK